MAPLRSLWSRASPNHYPDIAPSGHGIYLANQRKSPESIDNEDAAYHKVSDGKPGPQPVYGSGSALAIDVVLSV